MYKKYTSFCHYDGNCAILQVQICLHVRHFTSISVGTNVELQLVGGRQSGLIIVNIVQTLYDRIIHDKYEAALKQL